jgi:hypothetical protein
LTRDDAVAILLGGFKKFDFVALLIYYLIKITDSISTAEVIKRGTSKSFYC